MKQARRRKTPETPIAKQIRMYARGYEAKGQKERADGMLQAADLVDDLSGRGGQAAAPRSAERADSLESRVDELERFCSALGFDAGGELAAGAVLARALPRAKPNGASKAKAMPAILSTGDVALSTGELRILTAAAQREGHGVTGDELTAMVDYRATSLRTYLGNLRAAGYLTTTRGRHYATRDGATRVESEPRVPFGSDLYRWWLGRLHAGEQKILQCVAEDAHGSIEASDLVGEMTGLRATSVRTYLNKLSARKLITRPERGMVAIAPILVDQPKG